MDRDVAKSISCGLIRLTTDYCLSEPRPVEPEPHRHFGYRSAHQRAFMTTKHGALSWLKSKPPAIN